MVQVKYTEKILRKAVKTANSYSEVLRNIGYKTMSGGMWSHIKKRISNLNIDTSHFTGHIPMKGKHSPTKKTPEEVLISNSTKKPNTKQLRRVLLEIGKEHKCECGLGPKWQNKNLVLQIDHIDGNRHNNDRNNLRFLCPNCHSQTDNFGVKNSHTYGTKNKKKCIDCDSQISRKGTRCRDCAVKNR